MSWLDDYERYNEEKHIFVSDAREYAEKHKEKGVQVVVYYNPYVDMPEGTVAYKINKQGLLILLEPFDVWDKDGINAAGTIGCIGAVFDREQFFMLFNNNNSNNN